MEFSDISVIELWYLRFTLYVTIIWMKVAIRHETLCIKNLCFQFTNVMFLTLPLIQMVIGQSLIKTINYWLYQHFHVLVLFWAYKLKLIRRVSLEAQTSEAATGDVLEGKMFLEISQNSQENTFARDSFWIWLQACGLQLY